jgi:T5SS/PEP-CTERM-associated repeat protein
MISDGAVIVAGAGSTWINSENLSIGEDFRFFLDTGLLQITSGGTVSTAATAILKTSTLEIGSSSTPRSPLTISGGTGAGYCRYYFF